VPDPECATFPATVHTANIGPCIGHYQAGLLQLGPSRYCWLPAAVSAECCCSAHLFSSGVRTHNPTAPGPSLVTHPCTGAIQFRLCVLVYHCVHGTALAYLAGSLQPTSELVAHRHLRSANMTTLHGAADLSGNSWRPRLSGGCGAGAEQSASTDHGHLVAVVFSAADKGPSVSAVVQVTSDYCTIVFFKSDM